MKKRNIIGFTLLLMELFIFPLIEAKKCQTQECAYTKINCEECCKAKTGVSPECCAACNNCMLYDDGGRSGCKDFPS
jgi:hypothetical protein